MTRQDSHANQISRPPRAGTVPDVEAHRMYSDERLKQAVAQVESALAGLRQLSTSPAGDDEVESHHMYSDERLKQAVTPAIGAVAALGSLGVVCG